MNTEISRAQLLQWANDTLKLFLQKIEQLGTGAVYCQLVDAVHPGKDVLGKINWKAKQEYQFVNNYKVLQESKNLWKQKNNLEFLQWLKKYMDQHIVPKDYDPQAKEEMQIQMSNQILYQKEIQKNQELVQEETLSAVPISSNQPTFQQEYFCPNGIIPKNNLLQTLKQERDFYFLQFKEQDYFIEGAFQLKQEQMDKGIKESRISYIALLISHELEVQELPPSPKEQSSSQDVMQQLIDL